MSTLQAKNASQLRLLRTLTGRWHSAYVAPQLGANSAQPAVAAEQPLHKWLDDELQTHRVLSFLLQDGSRTQQEAAEHGFMAQARVIITLPVACFNARRGS